MGYESITEEKLQELVRMKKTVTNPNARRIEKHGHYQINYKAAGGDGYQFLLYTRQNKLIDSDFSCGLLVILTSGELLTLRRYNGPSHCHRNQIENDLLCYNSHIHQATLKYISANKKPEGYAKVSKGFNSLNGALHCLVKDCNILGINTIPDMPKLFD